MSKIKALSPLDRPREKAYRFGLEKLNDDELLALIISHGTKGQSALEIARSILNEKINLYGLLRVPYQEYRKLLGLDKVISLKIAATFEILNRIIKDDYNEVEKAIQINSEYIFNRYRLFLSGLTQEVMVLVVLSRCKRIVFEKTLYKGTDSNVVFSYRDIFKLILLNNGYFFYIIHNHPSGNYMPSEKDIIFTAEVFRYAKMMKILLLDHIIVDKNRYFSFKNDDSPIRYLFINKNS